MKCIEIDTNMLRVMVYKINTTFSPNLFNRQKKVGDLKKNPAKQLLKYF
jgi:hypothetical protein